MKFNKSILMTLFVFIVVIIFILIIYKNKVIDNFDNLESNLYTYDTCCSASEIANCESYGKTGVCNYFLNNKSCLCQNAF